MGSVFVTANRICSGLDLALAAELKPRGKAQESFGAQLSSPLPRSGLLSGAGGADPQIPSAMGQELGWVCKGDPELGEDQAVMGTCSRHPPHGSPPHPAPGMGHRSYARACWFPFPAPAWSLHTSCCPRGPQVPRSRTLMKLFAGSCSHPSPKHHPMLLPLAPLPSQHSKGGKQQPLPGLLASCCCASPVERGSLPWDDRRGKESPSSQTGKREEPLDPAQGGLRSPQHPPFPASTQAAAPCCTQSTQCGGEGHPGHSPRTSPDARRRGGRPELQVLCGLPHPCSATLPRAPCGAPAPGRPKKGWGG